MIKNIIFDMGQVLIRWRSDDILNHFVISDEDKELMKQEMFHSPEWIQMDRGVITEDELTEIVCNRLPQSLHGAAEKIINSWYEWCLIPMPGMAQIVRELKQKGYGIYLLSNAATPLRSYFPNIPGSECFDGLLVSAEEKLLKPQHEIYERLYERFALRPQECLFIDDVPANIEGAMLTGMNGIVFRGDTEKLRCQLTSLGIL